MKRPPSNAWLRSMAPAKPRWMISSDAVSWWICTKSSVRPFGCQSRATYEQRLLEHCADPERPSRALVAQLLEFHRREAKPQWWAMFDRQSSADEELIEDAECLGGLQVDPTQPPVQDKRSLVFTYRF